MNTDKKLTVENITQDCISAVNTYLMARTLYECERVKVDKIQQAILDAHVYNYAKEWSATRRGGLSGRITSLNDTYLMSDKDHHEFLTFVRGDLERAGYKIKSTPGDPVYSFCCPALVAESMKRDAEHLIIEAFAAILGADKDFGNSLLCNGLDQYHRFIDLCIKLVVNMPGYKNPLTGQEVI